MKNGCQPPVKSVLRSLYSRPDYRFFSHNTDQFCVNNKKVRLNMSYTNKRHSTVNFKHIFLMYLIWNINFHSEEMCFFFLPFSFKADLIFVFSHLYKHISIYKLIEICFHYLRNK